MRLLKSHVSNTVETPLVLEEFSGQDVPRYAILSHTWGEDEVLLSHIEQDTASSRHGFAKLKGAIDRARDDGFHYIWVDTCCIDKSSSAELSEAINSMFRWYSSSAICYAYLKDVSDETPPPVDISNNQAEFAQSRWFTRGWCLQELLAPSKLIFYNSRWSRIGDKHSLKHQIASITNIDTEILSGVRAIESVSIATRMSWASTRKTRRVEDIAYCLEEIMKYSNDQSLFAWRDLNISPENPHGLLADSPAAFAASSDVVRLWTREESPSFEMTNKGLRISLKIARTARAAPCFAKLHCTSPDLGNTRCFGIYLWAIETNQWGRVRCDELSTTDSPTTGTLTTIYVDQRLLSIGPAKMNPFHCLLLWFSTDTTKGYEIVSQVECETTAEEQFHQTEVKAITQPGRDDSLVHCSKLLAADHSISAATLLRRRDNGKLLVIMIGRRADSGIGFDAVEVGTSKLESISKLQPHFCPKKWPDVVSTANHEVSLEVTPESRGTYVFYKVRIDVLPKAITPAIMPLPPQLVGKVEKRPKWMQSISSRLRE